MVYSIIRFILLISCLVCFACQQSIDSRIQGKWEVISGGGLFFTAISSFEFSNGKAYMTQTSLVGKITTPTEYSINDEKVIVGGYIFEFIDDNTLETKNLPMLKFKMKKVQGKY